jgi:hypothetical protein
MHDRDRKDYTVSVEEGIKKYEDASEAALSRLADLGINATEERPCGKDGEYFDGRLPANVNDLTMRELGELFNMMDLWANWISSYAVAAKAEVSNKEEQLKLVRSRIMKSKAGTAKDKDNDTLCDERYVDANARFMEAAEYFSYLNSLEEAARRDLRVISRLIEVRKMEFEGGRRGDNIGRDRDPYRRS